ncbi:hypothetical protein K1T71_000419 [Dendrolimus kikuchii]|uniref:Uncharacterized protein n=1 Tax=Dendrolimus kikuchii TaxID=765133 RepID=A0ACC1DJI9_9NEOP|nr:hypothetical protein K1T71_000419 [Dendrolimus kikuchii]
MKHFGMIFSIGLWGIREVNTSNYDKKTIDGMILKTLWTKVFLGYDPEIKEEGIKTLRKSGDYQKLIDHLTKVKKEKVQRLLDLIAEVIITYMS